MDIERYIVFRKRLNFISIYTVDDEKIEIQIFKNVFYRQPYSTEWHDYIKKTCLQVYPKLENPFRVFSKQYNRIKIQRPF